MSLSFRFSGEGVGEEYSFHVSSHLYGTNPVHLILFNLAALIGEPCLVKTTNHEALHYTIYPASILFLPQFQILSAPCSQISVLVHR
jgi:hypothetical protein